MTTISEPARGAAGGSVRQAVGGAFRDPLVRYALIAYACSRLLFLAIASLNLLTQHASLQSELSHWDGYWYLRTASQWYYHHVFHHSGQYSTLGFLPLYPALTWLLAKATLIGYFGAGLAISLICGAIATALIGYLARAWWGEEAARRSLLFWCFFPGTIVFSMVYTESLMLMLVAGALILLERRRYGAAGLFCGFASAIAAASLSAIPVCIVASLQVIRRRGIGLTRDAPARVLRDREARRSLAAPLLSPFGAVGFAIFLWFWTGSPLADYTAQHVAWQESTTPLAVPYAFGSTIHEIFIGGVGSHGPGGIDLNHIVAVLGCIYLLVALWWLWRERRGVTLPAAVWTGCVAFLALTSTHTPPNPRMLVLAFPVVIVVGARFSGRAFHWAMAINLALTLVMSYFTFYGIWLRP